jgi:hypothetical protein
MYSCVDVERVLVEEVVEVMKNEGSCVENERWVCL